MQADIPTFGTISKCEPPFINDYPEFSNNKDVGKNPFGHFYEDCKRMGNSNRVEDRIETRRFAAVQTTELVRATVNHFESEAKTLNEGLQYYAYMLNLCGRSWRMQWMIEANYYSDEAGNLKENFGEGSFSPAFGNEILWRGSEFLLRRLHERFDYSLKFGTVIYGNTYPLDNPVPVDYRRLATPKTGAHSVDASLDAVLQDPKADRYMYRLFAVGESHKDPRYCNAVDIIAPLGTPVYSTVNGQILEIVQDSKEGGNDEKYANEDNRIRIIPNEIPYIAISLRHFTPRRTYRKIIGNLNPLKNRPHKISEGAQVGTIGATGWTSLPHVHMEVGEYFHTPAGYMPRFTYPIVITGE